MKFIKTLSLLSVLLFAFTFFIPNNTYVKAACKSPTAPPATAPVLLSAVAADGQVTLTWQKAEDPVTHYLLQYGTDSENYEYGNPNIGNRDTTSYTVSSLTNGTKYYFRVRAENGCKPGDFSDKITAVAGVKRPDKVRNLLFTQNTVLGATTSATTLPTKIKGAQPSTAQVDAPVCAECKGINFLIAEVIALVAFYAFMHLYKRFSRFTIAAFLIPVVTYILFELSHEKCSKELFFCDYFIFLNVGIFVLLTVLHKQLFISRRERIYKALDDLKKKI